MNPTTERGLLLFQQGRHELAIQQFQQALAADPHDGFVHACVALCLARQQKYAEASDAAARAITSSPDLAFAHYAAASVFHDRNRLQDAEQAVTESIRLNPYEASYHGLAAAIRFEQSDWHGALERATKGLEIDPDDTACTNVRAMAMVRLGKAVDATVELRSSLGRDPDNAYTHASLGWAALDRGDRQQALESFRESLRIDPNLGWAREGMLHAIKLGYPLYGLLLKYLLAMQKLSPRARWGVVLGGYVGYRLLRGVARGSPELAPFLIPILITYIGFAYLTWIDRPITNVFLRFNRFGRAILNDDERRESTLVGTTLAVGLLSGAVYLATHVFLAFCLFILCAALTIPFSAIYQCQNGWPRKASSLYATALALLGVVLIASILLNAPVETVRALGSAFVIGTIAAPWVSNFLMMTRVQR